MTETGTPETAARKTCHKKAKWFSAAILLLVIAGFAAYRFCPWIVGMHNAGAADNSRLEQRLATAEQQIRTLNNRIDELNAQAPKISAPASSEAPAASSTLAHMQSDLVALSSAVNGLQEEVKRTSAAATQTQKAAQSSVASAVAFIQLRDAAEAGSGFASELANLRAAAPDDAQFHEITARLDPYAAKGAPVVNMLREEFIALEPPVSVAMKKANAQSWWQRLLAELSGLITIRPLHGGDAMDACSAAEEALSGGDVKAALSAVKTLPPEAQDVLKDWKTKAGARDAIDSALRDLSARFSALAGSPPSSAQDEP